MLAIEGKNVFKNKKDLAKTAKSLISLSAETQNRTADTGIFSPLLYRLSYLGLVKLDYRVSIDTGQD